MAPSTPDLQFRHLFNGRDLDHFEYRGDWRKQQNLLENSRKDAVRQILNEGGMPAVLAAVHNADSPYKVGFALGSIADEKVEPEIIPSLLISKDETETQFVAGFVWGQFGESGWNWVDRVLDNDWDNIQKSAFLALLPFEENTWIRIMGCLGQENGGLYWKTVTVNPWGEDRDLTLAIEKLIEYGRSPEAIKCLYRVIHGEEEEGFKEDLAIRALLSVPNTPGIFKRIDTHEVMEVISRLQKSPSADSDALFEIEWRYMNLLRWISPWDPVTLEKRLASDPCFFSEVLALLYASTNEDDNNEELNEEMKARVECAYHLLNKWKICPGNLPGEPFIPIAFADWVEKAKQITSKNGYGDVGQSHIGRVLIYAPSDPDGLWIHKEVASALDKRDADKMRSGFTIALLNQRGVHGYSRGREEQKLSQRAHEKAEALENEGFFRFAAEMHNHAKMYEREAQRESKRDPMDH